MINDSDKFLVNDGSKTETITWSELKGDIDIPDVPISSGQQPPQNPSLGDIWIDLSDCPPTINVWDDCDDPGNPIWRPIGGGELPGCQQGAVQIVSSNGTEIGSTLTATGGNGIDEGTALTATYAWTGAKTGTGSTIVADVEGDYTVTATITCTDTSTLSTSATWSIVDSYADMVNNTPPVIAVVGGGVDEAYEGNSLYVVTNATVNNGENPVIVENRWFKDGSADGTGQLYTINSGNEGASITCKQLFRDARNNEILSNASNNIIIVARPADAIGFTPVITDDGTPLGNTVGRELTASALNITGGVAAQEYAFQWYANNIPEAHPSGAAKVKTINPFDVGKVITCDITVAEPDGTNPETRTAVYSRVPEVAGTINTPTVLAPADGAGDTTPRAIVTDTITAVDNTADSYTCETDLIESVDTTTDAPNIVLELSGTKDLDCFEAGDAVQTVLTGEWVSGNFPTGYEGSKAFDGIALAGNNTCAVPTADDLPETCRWEGSIKIPTGATVTASVWRQTDSGYLKVNDVDVTPAATGITINLTTIDISTAAGSEITSLEINRTIANNGGIGFAAIYINGVAVTSDSVVKVVSKDPDATPPTITVDGGDWQGTDDVPADQNRDQVWSDNVTATASYKTGWENTKIFDGNTSTGCTTGDPGNVNRITITFPEGIDYLTSIHTSRTDGPTTSGAVYCAVNDEPDNSSTEVPHNPDGNIKTEIRSGSGTLNKLEFFNNGPSNPAVNNIWIDGKLLVDPAGDTTVKGKTASWDTTLTLAGPKDLDVLKVGDTVKMGDAADVPYQPVSDSIVTVTPDSPSAGQTTLTLSDDTDLAYFRKGDVVQSDSLQTGDVWSDYFKAKPQYPLGTENVGANLKAFNGTYDGGQPGYFSTADGTFPCIWEPPTPINYYESVKVIDGMNGQKYFLNDNTEPGDEVITTNSSSPKEYTLASGSGQLSKITVDRDKEIHAWYELIIDGKVLLDPQHDGVGEVKITSIDATNNKIIVDGGSWYADPTNGGDGSGDEDGDTEVTCLSPLKAPTDWKVERIDTDNNQLSLSHTTPDDNAQVWVANDNQAGTDFNVTADRTVAGDPLLTADVRLKSSLFATTPENADTLDKYIWSITPDGGAETLQETTSNPYTPTGLALDTWHTVTVTHRGNALGESDPSGSITFKTGLSRNLYTYYKERVELLESRLASIEADEVNDDATDTLLISTVANLIERVEQLEGGA